MGERANMRVRSLRWRRNGPGDWFASAKGILWLSVTREAVGDKWQFLVNGCVRVKKGGGYCVLAEAKEAAEGAAREMLEDALESLGEVCPKCGTARAWTCRCEAGL